SICLQLALLMGGDIGVDSTPDQGSTFWFTIKCQIPTSTAQNQLVSLDQATCQEMQCITHSLATARILICSAASATVSMLKSILEPFYFDVATTPSEAVQRLEESAQKGNHFDFAVWDFARSDTDPGYRTLVE